MVEIWVISLPSLLDRVVTVFLHVHTTVVLACIRRSLSQGFLSC